MTGCGVVGGVSVVVGASGVAGSGAGVLVVGVDAATVPDGDDAGVGEPATGGGSLGITGVVAALTTVADCTAVAVAGGRGVGVTVGGGRVGDGRGVELAGTGDAVSVGGNGVVVGVAESMVGVRVGVLTVVAVGGGVGLAVAATVAVGLGGVGVWVGGLGCARQPTRRSPSSQTAIDR